MKELKQYIKDNESSLISLNEKLVINKDFKGLDDYEYSREEIADEMIERFDIQKYNLSDDEYSDLKNAIISSLKKFNIKSVHGRNIYFFVPSDCVNKLSDEQKELFTNTTELYTWTRRGKNGPRETIFYKSVKRPQSMTSDILFSLHCWKNDFDEIEFPYYEEKNNLTLICRIII